MPTVEQIVSDPDLRLRLVTAADGLERRVTAATATEHLDPTPWLWPGVLLLTTAENVSEAEMRAYADRLAGRRIAALGIGVGEGLRYLTTPEAMANAAEAAGMPLLEVPSTTPFAAVIQALYRRLAAEQHDGLQRTLAAQRTLERAAVRPDGASQIVRALAELTQMWVAVIGRDGEVHLASEAGLDDRLADIRGDLPRLRRHQLRGSAAYATPMGHARVRPLGVQRIRGFLVCGSATDIGNDTGDVRGAVTEFAASLLSLEWERRHAAATAKHDADADLLRKLFADQIPERRALRELASHGITTEQIRVLATTAAGQSPEETRDTLVDALPEALTLISGGVVLALLPHTQDLIETVVAALPGHHIGVGGPVLPVAASASLRHARHALALARRTNAAVVDATTLASAQLLLQQTPEALQSYVDAVLGPLDHTSESARRALVHTLRSYFDHDEVHTATAAALGVTRATVRERLRRVELLTGRNLGVTSDRVDLCLALLATDVLEVQRHRQRFTDAR